jgi:hypothetical protein
MNMNVSLTVSEADLLLEALRARASRHESMARANPRGAAPHDQKAAAMHKLRDKLLDVYVAKRERRS